MTAACVGCRAPCASPMAWGALARTRGTARGSPQLVRREEHQMTPPHAVPPVARSSGRPLTSLPGPRGLPLLGNLLQLKATQLPTILEQWADRYGTLYTLRLGRKPVVAELALIQTVLRHRPETFRRLR